MTGVSVKFPFRSIDDLAARGYDMANATYAGVGNFGVVLRVRHTRHGRCALKITTNYEESAHDVLVLNALHQRVDRDVVEARGTTLMRVVDAFHITQDEVLAHEFAPLYALIANAAAAQNATHVVAEECTAYVHALLERCARSLLDETEYFVHALSYHPGRTLHAVLDDLHERASPTTRRRVCTMLLARVLASLAAHHAADVAHCDVHTNNVLVDAKTRAVVLIDYGMAMGLAEHDDVDISCREATRLPCVGFGTRFAHMPPERAMTHVLRVAAELDDDGCEHATRSAAAFFAHYGSMEFDTRRVREAEVLSVPQHQYIYCKTFRNAVRRVLGRAPESRTRLLADVPTMLRAGDVYMAAHMFASSFADDADGSVACVLRAMLCTDYTQRPTAAEALAQITSFITPVPPS